MRWRERFRNYLQSKALTFGGVPSRGGGHPDALLTRCAEDGLRINEEIGR